jgi:hypothetical protein
MTGTIVVSSTVYFHIEASTFFFEEKKVQASWTCREYEFLSTFLIKLKKIHLQKSLDKQERMKANHGPRPTTPNKARASFDLIDIASHRKPSTLLRRIFT